MKSRWTDISAAFPPMADSPLDGAPPKFGPAWLEILSAGAVILLNLHLMADVVQANLLYLGGDTTRDAWQAAHFLKTGDIAGLWSDIYSSDLYFLALAPLLLLIRDPVLLLQFSGILFAGLTVTALYIFVRRSYGLLPAVCLGILYATSPMLAAHCAFGAEYGQPLLIGLILLLDSLEGRRARCATMVTAGLFAGIHLYFLFPFLVYLIWKWKRYRGSGAEGVLGAGLYPLCFLAGFIPFCLSHIASRGVLNLHGDGRWLGAFLQLALRRWQHPYALFRGLGSVLTLSLDAFPVWGPGNGVILTSPLVVCWTLSLAAGIAWPRTRRLVAALLIGIAAAGLIQSDIGLGARHMVAFLPYYWLMLAPMIAEETRRPGRWVLVLLAGFLGWQQYLAVRNSLRALARDSEATLIHARLREQIAADLPCRALIPYPNDDHVAWYLRFRFPEKLVLEEELASRDFLRAPHNTISGIIMPITAGPLSGRAIPWPLQSGLPAGATQRADEYIFCTADADRKL